MGSRALQLTTLALLATGLTGFRIESQSASTSNTPLVRKVDTKTRTNMTHCNWYAAGWIPVGQTKSLDDMIRQISAGSDGLIDITVDSSSTNLGIISWHCWKVAGTPFAWGGALSTPPAVATEGTPTEGTPTDAAPEAAAAPPAAPAGPVISVVPPPPPKAEPHTKRLLDLLGATRPESDDDYRRLCSEVWTLRMQNKLSESQMIQLTRSGSGLVAPGSDLMSVLRAGLAAPAGK
jgi:hypothetical protein